MRYRDLPLLAGTDIRHAWDYFGRDDRIGTLNFQTAQARQAAQAAVRTGESIGLSLPLDQPSYPPFGRGRLQHEMFRLNSFSWDDRLLSIDMQASTQWDGLQHVGHRQHGFYGGRQGPPESTPEIGIDVIATRGIIGRAVLVDIGRFFERDQSGYRPLEPYAIEAELIAKVLEFQGTALSDGDVLCFRFGWHQAFAELSESERQENMARPRCAGLSARDDIAEFLWDHKVAAVVCDNPTVEVQPGSPADGFLHQRLITALGMPLGELFALDDLAEACTLRAAWDFMFFATPLNIPGGVGSPGNAVAVI